MIGDRGCTMHRVHSGLVISRGLFRCHPVFPGTPWYPRDPCVILAVFPGSSASYRTRSWRNRAELRARMTDTRQRFTAKRAEVLDRVKSMTAPFKENIVTIPNLLCVARIGLTPVIGYFILNGNFSWACGTAAVAGATDLLDGFIARHFPSQRSMIGSFLDPLADKLLITTLFLTLTAVHLIPVPLTALIVFRDICLVAAASVVRFRSLPPPVTLSKYFDATYASANLSPTTISKYNTGLQLLLVVVTLAAPVFNYVDHPVLHGLWYIVAASTLASGLGYMFQKDTYKLFRRTPPS
ncbi:probable cardiolipin synthase (CMP-forming) [Paramacrobiotus metropolitanus]|uniref:probable cardiolipin synthase (CMP-forming) n=1 Tax=Paramacrobiotus metropolitanus TaxID=2943436 RepID=UPI002445B8E5|nr:probable cardiolipin synthase (CMP-forming) [Paramacrobiotus metropolitanus]XP_055348816.1 probable cardiolipin synthase (CMP-forming) [Paramacrobiotus metropolitanus]